MAISQWSLSNYSVNDIHWFEDVNDQQTLKKEQEEKKKNMMKINKK